MALNLQVFNRSLERLGVIDVITGLTWEEKLADAGSFELWCPVTDYNLELLKENNLLWIGGTSAGVIEFKESEADEEGTQTLHIQGRLCESYLDSRVTYPRLSTTGTLSTVLRKLLTDYIVSPSDAKRKLPNIVLDSDQVPIGQSISFQNLGATVLENCSNLCQAYSIGFRLKFLPRTKQFVFQVFQGSNRTVTQTDRTPVLFSSELDDILESKYLHNTSEYKNFAYIAGEGEGKDRVFQSTGSSASGLDRKELFVDAKDLQSTDDEGNPIGDAKYKAMLIERGKTKLEDYKDIETFSATLRTFGLMSYQYGVDYFLGDTVTVYDSRLKVQTTALITAVTRVFDEDGERLELTFGYSQLTIANKLRRVM